ncbi:MAG: ATP-dependent DNA helicase [Myxococcota bacterium]|nr:ATP-dependent DNA helicase [Myxococcota bacterium]
MASETPSSTNSSRNSSGRGRASSARAQDGHRPSGADLDQALHRFGLDTWRPGQREAIEHLLDEGQVLLVAPTGGGKSLSYQVPGLLLGGTSLVISPLVSLMHDQVAALEALSIPATFLASTLTAAEMRERLDGLSAGRYKLVYVAPERFAVPDFAPRLERLDCPLIAIDEAHCISEWGHDFRPDYLQIGRVLERFPDARVLACTATATPVVRDEIIERLGLPNETRQLIHGFARPNLALRVKEVSSQAQRNAWVDDVLGEALDSPGTAEGAAIIYSPTRKATKKEADRLAARGWRTGVYHAGLEPGTREAAHRAFSEGRVDVVVATNAFGMGIDRADVRAVIHLAPPGSIEAYYQEVGRAGRDGRDAVGLMLLSPGDMPRRRHLIESDASGAVPSPEAVQHKWNLFLELMRFAEGGSCRHDAVLRYFDDEDETLAGCGRCDVCRHFEAGGDASQDFDDEAVSLIVRKALSGVARIHGQFGLSAAVALLRGVTDPRLERQGLQRTTTFGVLSEFGDDWLTRLLRRCVTAGWVDFFGGDRPVAALTEDGIAAMKGERPTRLLLPPLKEAGRRTSGRSRARGSSPPESELDAAQGALFEALRAHRLEVARDEGVPPYVVASDRALRDIARLQPADFETLQLANGIGPNKAARYGDGLLAVVRDHLP